MTSAAAAEYSIARAPAWVEAVPVPVAPPASPEQAGGGVDYLLSDLQVHVDDASVLTEYRHFAARLRQESGAESVSHIELPFNPAFQRLRIHALTVWRGGRAQSRLGSARVQVLQREQQLESRIFDGRKTANIFLEDVRIGDIVEYAYSIEGSNPAFEGKLSGWFEQQWGVPVQTLLHRLLVPAEREVVVKPRNQSLQPSMRTMDGMREYRWTATGVAPIRVERDAPSWYDASASVQWSDYRSWSEVARHALRWYPRQPQLPPELQARAAAIARNAADPAERLVAALALVQREVRYLGLEVGQGSYVPNPPALVWQRRFGDCKDKAVLLIGLLDALGIEARPALVATGFRQTVAEYVPTPAVFDHVIVQARIGDTTFWVDPTRPPQRGGPKDLLQPNYRRALVLDETTTALTEMRPVESGLHKRRVTVTYDLRAGIAAPALFNVRTEAEGAGAESLRAVLNEVSQEETQKRYLNFYAAYFPASYRKTRCASKSPTSATDW